MFRFSLFAIILSTTISRQKSESVGVVKHRKVSP